jgi:hypothetical protein
MEKKEKVLEIKCGKGLAYQLYHVNQRRYKFPRLRSAPAMFLKAYSCRLMPEHEFIKLCANAERKGLSNLLYYHRKEYEKERKYYIDEIHKRMIKRKIAHKGKRTYRIFFKSYTS